MADYCIDCKYGGKTSGSEIYCDKHDRWMDRHGHCSDYIWIKARTILFEKGDAGVRFSRSQTSGAACWDGEADLGDEAKVALNGLRASNI